MLIDFVKFGSSTKVVKPFKEPVIDEIGNDESPIKVNVVVVGEAKETVKFGELIVTVVCTGAALPSMKLLDPERVKVFEEIADGTAGNLTPIPPDVGVAFEKLSNPLATKSWFTLPVAP